MSARANTLDGLLLAYSRKSFLGWTQYTNREGGAVSTLRPTTGIIILSTWWSRRGEIILLKTSPRTDEQRQSNMAQSTMVDDEDWTKIQELSTRRRLQNRISQRNHSKKKPILVFGTVRLTAAGQKIRKRLEQLEAAVAAGPLCLPNNSEPALAGSSGPAGSEHQDVGASRSANDGMMLHQPPGNQSEDAFGMFLSSDSMSDLEESPATDHCSRGQQFPIPSALPRTHDTSLTIGESYMSATPDEEIPFPILGSPDFSEQQNFDFRFEHGHSHIHQSQLQPQSEHAMLDPGQKSTNDNHQHHLSRHQPERQQRQHHLPQVSTDDTLRLQTRAPAHNRGRSTQRTSTTPIHNFVPLSPASTARPQISRPSSSPSQGSAANFPPRRPVAALSTLAPAAQARRGATHAASFSSGAANLRDHPLAYMATPRNLSTYNLPSPKSPPIMPSFEQQRSSNNTLESEGRFAPADPLTAEPWLIENSRTPAQAAQGTSDGARTTRSTYHHAGPGPSSRSTPHGFCPQCACQRRDLAGGGPPRYVTVRVPVDSWLGVE